MNKKFIGLILVGGLIISGSMAMGREVKTESPKENFVLSENTVQETRLVKISKVDDNVTMMTDVVGNEFEVETTSDYSVGDTWFINITRDGIKEVYRENDIDSSSEMAHRARAKRLKNNK